MLAPLVGAESLDRCYELDSPGRLVASRPEVRETMDMVEAIDPVTVYAALISTIALGWQLRQQQLGIRMLSRSKLSA